MIKWQCKRCTSRRYRIISTKLSKDNTRLERKIACYNCRKRDRIFIELQDNQTGKRNIRTELGIMSLKRYVWELKNGSILLHDNIVLFRNFDKSDYRPDNLIAVPKGELPDCMTVFCHQCSHVWIPKKSDPKRCPECGTEKWNLNI